MSEFKIDEGDLVVHTEYGVCRVLGVEPEYWGNVNRIYIAEGAVKTEPWIEPGNTSRGNGSYKDGFERVASGVKKHWVHPSSLRPWTAADAVINEGDVVIDREFGVCTVLKVEEEIDGDADTVCIREAGGLGAKMHWVHPSRLRSAGKGGASSDQNGTATHVWGHG